MAPYAFPNLHPAYHPQRQSHPPPRPQQHHHHHHHYPQPHHPQQPRLPAPPPPRQQPPPPPPPTHRRAHSSPPGVASYYRLYSLPPHVPRAAVAAHPPWSPDPGPNAVYIPVVPSPAEVAMAHRMHAAGEQMRRADAMTPRSHAHVPLPPPQGMGIYGWAGCGCPLVEGLVPRRGGAGAEAGMVPWGAAGGARRQQHQQQGERYLRGVYDGVPERRRRTSAPPPRLAFRRTPTPVARAERAHFATARQHWIGGEGEGGYLTASETEVTTEDDDSLATWEVYGDYDDVPYYEEDPEDEEDEEDEESLVWDFMNGDYVRPEVVYRSFCGCCPE